MRACLALLLAVLGFAPRRAETFAYFEPPPAGHVTQALEVLGLDKIQAALGMRGAEQGARQVSKNELFDLLNQAPLFV